MLLLCLAVVSKLSKINLYYFYYHKKNNIHVFSRDSYYLYLIGEGSAVIQHEVMVTKTSNYSCEFFPSLFSSLLIYFYPFIIYIHLLSWGGGNNFR